MLTANNNIWPQEIPRLNIKLEHNSNFQLPPTPPSCSSSSSEDSEDNMTVSRPPSPAVRKSNARVMITNHHHSSTRQPINTPLISSQPVSSCFSWFFPKTPFKRHIDSVWYWCTCIYGHACVNFVRSTRLICWIFYIILFVHTSSYYVSCPTVTCSKTVVELTN